VVNLRFRARPARPGSPALWSSSLMGGPGVGPMERHLTTPDASCVRTIWICEVLPGVRGMQVKRARKRWIHGERCSQSCPKKESYMKRSLASRKMEIAPFSVERKRCQPLRLRHGRLVNRMLPFVMWTELKGEKQADKVFSPFLSPIVSPRPECQVPTPQAVSPRQRGVWGRTGGRRTGGGDPPF